MDNPFKNLLKPFLSSTKKSDSVIAIDVGSSFAKVVQLKKKSGKAILETYGEVALGPYAGTDIGRSTVLGADKLSEAITDLLKGSNTTTLNCCLSIPIGSSFIVFMTVPTSDPKKIAEMVPIEARKYIPVSISEVTIDWLTIPKDETALSEFQNGKEVEEKTGTEILLVVIHNDALSKNKEIQKQTGLSVSFSEVEIFSSIRSCMESSLAPQMLIDFGAASAKVFIVEKGILRASHVINRGSQDITIAIQKSMNISYDEAEKIKRAQGILDTPENANVIGVSTITIDYILAEVGRFVIDYAKKSGNRLSKIILTGGGSQLKGLKEKAQATFETPIEMADPFSKVEYPAFLEEVLKVAGPEFSVVIGLAIRKLQEI